MEDEDKNLIATDGMAMICRTLQMATDPNHEIVKPAEKQLAEWESQSGFFLTLARLCNISDSQQIGVNVRWMAAVYMKNGINKYWRRYAKHELSQQEKQEIRQILLSHFGSEYVPAVSLQVAVLISRIARLDFPREWPELVPELLKILQMTTTKECNDVLLQQRVLLVLHHVIKALASRRMYADKRVFEELCGNIFGFLLNLWDTLTTLSFNQLKNMQKQEAMQTFERSLLSLRILRKLSIYGFNNPYKSEACICFMQQLFQRLKLFIQCRYELRQLRVEEDIMNLLEKLIMKQMKTIYEFQDMHPKSFAQFVPTALNFSFYYVFDEGTGLIFDNNVLNFTNFALYCINLMKSIMLCSSYASTQSSIRERTEAELLLPIELHEFFTKERLSYISEKMITHYFLLTQVELDLWMEDPEAFAQDDSGDSWKYAIRPAIETLYLTCFTQYSDDMTNDIKTYVERAQQITLTPNSDLKDILLKDAIYNAAGIAATYFFNLIDFDAWFTGQLLAELHIDTESFQILRRRIIWLVAEWTAVKFSRNLRPLAFEACIHLLRPTENVLIRLTASRSLSHLIDDFEFMPMQFQPFLESSFNYLFLLLQEAKECDTKMRVLTIMTFIVEKMSEYVEKQADKLITYLPLLWKESEAYNMLRCAIICTLQQLVKISEKIPPTILEFSYGVIELSIDMQQPSHVYLMEEGLLLWLAVVENSTNITPQLFGLCKYLLPIIEMSSENLRTVIFIIQAYILLDDHNFLELYGRQFVAFCVRMFEDIRVEGVMIMLKVFDVCLKPNNAFGLELIRPALPYIVKQVYLNKDFQSVVTTYLVIISRVLLIDQSVFTLVLQELQLSNALDVILDVWLKNIALVSESDKRKLFSLAFGCILSNNEIILDRFSAILQNIADTLNLVMLYNNDLHDTEDNETQISLNKEKYTDSLVFTDKLDCDINEYSKGDDVVYKTYHYDRCKQLSLKDPVHIIVLPEYIEFRLNALRADIGEVRYQSLMKTVCPEVIKTLAHYLNANLLYPLTI